MSRKKNAGLPEKHQGFIDAYFECFYNGAKAARQAGYSVRRARQTAHELKRRPEIKAIIEERFEAQLAAIREEGERLYRERCKPTKWEIQRGIRF
jgi:phage terminase small subunit